MEKKTVDIHLRKSRFLPAALLALTMGGGYALTPSEAHAAPSVCPATEKALETAIANAGNGGTVKLFCSSATTVRFSKPITISQGVILDASASHATITFDGNKSSQLFHVNSSLGLNSLRFVNGSNVGKRAHGAAIHNAGTLSVSNSTFDNNAAVSGGGSVNGGAIYNDGNLSVTRSTFSHNTARGSGAAIYNYGPLKVTKSAFSRNSAGVGGAAIYNTATVALSDCTFSHNTADKQGGAIQNAWGTLNVTKSSFSHNTAGGSGGAIFNALILTASHDSFTNNSARDGGAIDNSWGRLNVTKSTFANNWVSAGGTGGAISSRSKLSVSNTTFTGNAVRGVGGDGGAISNSAGTATVNNSTFANNSAAAGGTIFSNGDLTVNNSTFANNSATDGGTILNASGKFTVTNSTFSSNSAEHGGAILNSSGTLAVSNSTFANNSAKGDGSDEATSIGGGIYNSGGTLTVSNSTFSNNSAKVGGTGGAIYNAGTFTASFSTFANNSAGSGGALSNAYGTSKITASIFAGSSSGGNCSGGTPIDGGYNLTDRYGNCRLNGSSDITNTNPQLMPLRNNGGPTDTMALRSSSPAIDVIPTSSGFCLATDQRGVTRPGKGGAFCDIGAYEYVVRAPVTLTYTGPMSIKTGSNTTLSAMLTTRSGGPIIGRVLRMRIGKGANAQSCLTGKTNTTGAAGCVIKNVKAWKSPNSVKVWFEGDPTGPNYEYSPAYTSAAVTIVP